MEIDMVNTISGKTEHISLPLLGDGWKPKIQIAIVGKAGTLADEIAIVLANKLPGEWISIRQSDRPFGVLCFEKNTDTPEIVQTPLAAVANFRELVVGCGLSAAQSMPNAILCAYIFCQDDVKLSRFVNTGCSTTSLSSLIARENAYIANIKNVFKLGSLEDQVTKHTLCGVSYDSGTKSVPEIVSEIVCLFLQRMRIYYPEKK